MAFNPGRNVGRISIRVVPDTTKFRAELRQQLSRVSKTTSMSVRVNANVDTRGFREKIQRELDGMKGVRFGAEALVKVNDKEIQDKVSKIKPTLDMLTVKRLRADIERALSNIEPTLTPSVEDRRVRQQLDHLRAAFDKVSGRLEHDILSPEEAERLRHRLNQIKDHIDHVARDRDTNLNVNPFTAWATARLRWLTRPRTVEIFVKVSKASIAKALTTLSALSGARLSWKWIDELIEKAGRLDKSLPAILGMTTGITSLVAAVAAATSGLVGVGQGLFTILPAFLVVPGLIINALGSLTALIVAMRDASDQLAVLKDDMGKLGDIISDTFWGRARQPIIDLVQGLMPQLRNAFRDLSEGIGDFTGALSNSLGKELANGRLESIFNGIADGWRILGTGADGFAGALVSLSNIAATYTPRLAGWFVRQADTFDAWLKAISEDGRLGAWMEDAIDSIYDVWDATRGIAGVFEGLWAAADAAGSGGLKGFAQMMLTWERVVKSDKFQRGATAIFRGSSVAMSAFSEAIQDVGDLLADLDSEVERFIGASGTFLGGLVGGIARALNSPQVADGLDRFSEGLVTGLDRIIPSLQPIADTFGNFLGLLGDLGSTVLPAAVGLLSDLMPSIDGIISAVSDVLPSLGDAVTTIGDSLGPALSEFVTDAAPVLAEALVTLAEVIAPIAELIGMLFDGIKSVFGGSDIDFKRKREFEKSGMMPQIADYNGDLFAWQRAYVEAAQKWMDENPLIPRTELPGPGPVVDEQIKTWYEGVRGAFEDGGAEAAQAFWDEYKIGSMTPEIRDEVLRRLNEFGIEIATASTTTGANISDGVASGITGSGASISDALSTALEEARTKINGTTGMESIGAAMGAGVIAGINQKSPDISKSLSDALRNAVTATRMSMEIHSPSKVAENMIGAPIGDGVVVGVASRRRAYEDSMRALVAIPSGLTPNGGVTAPAAGKAAEPAAPAKYEFNVHGVKQDPAETGQVAAHTFAKLIGARPA